MAVLDFTPVPRRQIGMRAFAPQDDQLLQGQSSLLLQTAIQDVYVVWLGSKVMSHMARSSSQYEHDEFEYVPLPPNRTFQMRVRVRMGEPGGPAPLPLNELGDDSGE